MYSKLSVPLRYGAYSGWSFVQMSGSHISQGHHQRRVASSQGSHSSSDDLTFGDVGPRVPSVTIAYFGRRISEESDPIFVKIDNYPEGGTYIPNAIPWARAVAYPADFIEGSDEAGPEVVTSSFGAEFDASTIMSSLNMRTLLNQLDKYGVPSFCSPTSPSEHCKANDPPEGFFAFSHLIMRAGARLPLCSYFIDILEYFGIAPLQRTPNDYSILSALYNIYAQLGFPQPTPLEVNYMYTLKKIPGGGAGFYYLLVWSLGKLNLIENTPSNADSWKESFF